MFDNLWVVLTPSLQIGTPKNDTAEITDFYLLLAFYPKSNLRSAFGGVGGFGVGRCSIRVTTLIYRYPSAFFGHKVAAKLARPNHPVFK